MRSCKRRLLMVILFVTGVFSSGMSISEENVSDFVREIVVINHSTSSIFVLIEGKGGGLKCNYITEVPKGKEETFKYPHGHICHNRTIQISLNAHHLLEPIRECKEGKLEVPTFHDLRIIFSGQLKDQYYCKIEYPTHQR